MLMVSWMLMLINNDDAMGQGWVNKSHSFFMVGLYWTSNQRFNTANKRPWTPDETQGRLHLGFVESATHCGGPCIQGNPQCFIRTAWWRSRKLEFFVHTKNWVFHFTGNFQKLSKQPGTIGNDHDDYDDDDVDDVETYKNRKSIYRTPGEVHNHGNARFRIWLHGELFERSDGVEVA